MNSQKKNMSQRNEATRQEIQSFLNNENAPRTRSFLFLQQLNSKLLQSLH